MLAVAQAASRLFANLTYPTDPTFGANLRQEIIAADGVAGITHTPSNCSHVKLVYHYYDTLKYHTEVSLLDRKETGLQAELKLIVLAQFHQGLIVLAQFQFWL